MERSNITGLLRGVFLALAVAGGFVLLGELAAMGMIALWSGGEAASIGIIGGADGPTAIFVTTSPGVLSREWRLALAMAAFGAGLGGLWKLRSRR